MKTKIIKSFTVFVLLLASMLMCFGCNLFKDANDSFTIVGEPTLSCVYNEESCKYDVTIEGVAKNNGEDVWGWVDITFVLYDAEGNVLGAANDFISYVGAQDTWRFKATCLTDYEVVSVKLDEFSGYVE